MRQAGDAVGVSVDDDRAWPPTVSVVVCTNGRRSSLETLVSSLRHLDYPLLEVCIVCGPKEDGTREFAATLSPDVKVVHCDEHNLSSSRNLGVAAAAGEIVAFVDDDGIPEVEWLRQLVEPFSDGAVAASGGLTYDHTGARLQYGYATCDRLGNPQLHLLEPATARNFPLADPYPYVQGTNCAIRRKTLVELGGFDEEYEFYLDETDLCCRIIDAGGKIAQLPGAFVHHKYLPSEIRNSAGVTIKKYAVLKNKVYFSHVNNHGHYDEDEVITSAVAFFESQRGEIVSEITAGRLSSSSLESFKSDVDKAWRVGLRRGMSGARRLRPYAFFANPPAFLPFALKRPAGGRMNLAFVSRSYPPQLSSGIGRYTHDLARGFGREGHNVFVIAESPSHDRVDFEEDVWVHRVKTRAISTAPVIDGSRLPQHIWDRISSVSRECRRIEHHHGLDLVEASNWDVEALALATTDVGPPLVVNLVTGLAHWMATHADERGDREWMDQFAAPVLAAERKLLERCELVIASTRAIAADFASLYQLTFPEGRVLTCVYGLEDLSLKPRKRPAAFTRDTETQALLFVGRLELRKGIDVLLQASGRILRAAPDAEIWIAGRPLPLEGGMTVESLLDDAQLRAEERSRVRILGEVSDAELRWLYEHCSAVAVPSQFESFGLTPIEAGMFGKPSICSAAGGLPEVVEDGKTGVIIPPGSPAHLSREVIRLLNDEELRLAMGEAARRRYQAFYTPDKAVAARLEAYRALVGGRQNRAAAGS